MQMKDKNPDYWQGYNNLQRVKHEIVKVYLDGWFPKLGYTSDRIVYFDSHAGKGKHATGDIGSPLVALTTFLNHRAASRILKNCEVWFYFVEADSDNVESLKQSIEEMGALPTGITVHISHGDGFQILQDILDNLKKSGNALAPAFLFIDPYGFTVPYPLIRELMSFRSVEAFINVMWRYIAMGINNPNTEKTLTHIFGGELWKNLIGHDFDEQSNMCADLIKDITNAQYSSTIKMLGSNNATEYFLLHLSNHLKGRNLMKDSIWKVCPDGGSFVRKNDNMYQSTLITPDANLDPICAWLQEQLSSGPREYEDLKNDFLYEDFREVHLNNTIRSMLKDGLVVAPAGKFVQKNNPTLKLPTP